MRTRRSPRPGRQTWFGFRPPNRASDCSGRLGVPVNSPGFPTGASRCHRPLVHPQEAGTQEAPPSDAACASQVGSDPGSEIPH